MDVETFNVKDLNISFDAALARFAGEMTQRMGAKYPASKAYILRIAFLETDGGALRLLFSIKPPKSKSKKYDIPEDNSGVANGEPDKEAPRLVKWDKSKDFDAQILEFFKDGKTWTEYIPEELKV